MSSIWPTSVKSLDENLDVLSRSLHKLEAAAAFEVDEVIQQLKATADSVENVRATVYAEIPEATWDDRPGLNVVLDEIGKRIEAREVEQRRARLLALAAELELGTITHRRAARATQVTQMRDLAVIELKCEADSPSPKGLPGPLAEQWVDWACNLQEPEDTESLQAVRDRFPNLDEFVANLESGMWSVERPDPSKPSREELAARELESQRSRLLALAAELEGGSVTHHRAVRVQQLNQLREQAIEELRSRAGEKGKPQILPGPAADQWIAWALSLQEPDDAESLQAIRDGFERLDEFVANLEPDMWKAPAPKSDTAPAPAPDKPAVTQQQTTPSQQKPAPTEQQTAPIQQKPAPIQQQTAPIQQKPAPIQQQTAQQKPAPAPQKSAPVQQQTAVPIPAPSAPVSAKREQTPAVDKKAAAVEVKTAPVDVKPEVRKDRPASEINKPKPQLEVKQIEVKKEKPAAVEVKKAPIETRKEKEKVQVEAKKQKATTEGKKPEEPVVVPVAPGAHTDRPVAKLARVTGAAGAFAAQLSNKVSELMRREWRIMLPIGAVLALLLLGGLSWRSHRRQAVNSSPIQSVEAKSLDHAPGTPDNKPVMTPTLTPVETKPATEAKNDKNAKTKDQNQANKPETQQPLQKVSVLDASLRTPSAIPKVSGRTDDGSSGSPDVPGTVPGALPGAVPTSVTNIARDIPVATPKASSQKVKVSSGVAQALLVHSVAPSYPAQARHLGIQGTVVLQAVIGKDGTVKSVHALRGPPLLISAATDAVKQWRYKPFSLNGEPAEADIQINVDFKP